MAEELQLSHETTKYTQVQPNDVCKQEKQYSFQLKLVLDINYYCILESIPPSSMLTSHTNGI